MLREDAYGRDWVDESRREAGEAPSIQMLSSSYALREGDAVRVAPPISKK